jgi:probable phosphoglycerate mutase
VNGGESLLDHKQRVLGFIRWLERQPQDNILVVAHEETMRVFVAYFEGNVPDERLRDLNIGNCEYRCYRSNLSEQSPCPDTLACTVRDRS